MRSVMRVALAQLNCCVGDCRGNAQKIIQALTRAGRARADLAVLPELAIPGYPPEDLLHRQDFVNTNFQAFREVVKASRRVPRLLALVGYVDRQGQNLYNAAALVQNGRVAGVYHKQILPNYGVFDEQRYFTPGTGSPLFTVFGCPVAVTVCEDLWLPRGSPVRALARSDARLIINLSASPYECGKIQTRERLFGRYAASNCAPLVYLNLVGGQDELIFDGQSLVFDRNGRVIARMAPFVEDWLVLDVDLGGEKEKVKGKRGKLRTPLPLLEEIYGALVLGVGDYARKNGFTGALVGLSGGIDSALTAVIATDALGTDKVAGVFMPSRYTSPVSREDASTIARRLGIRWIELPVEGMFSAYLEVLDGHVEGPAGDLVRQNLQARIRGGLLMALSNRYGWLLLATGNKSEMSVGYATLYGDLAGGFAALKDVPKTLVYKLARWRNRRGRRPVIPERTFTRAPTAELRPNQKDADSLPPYPELDPILKAYVEEGSSLREIVRGGFSPQVVRKVAQMVERSEYKRRQAPPGVKIQPKAFGKDRRNPITHKFAPWNVLGP